MAYGSYLVVHIARYWSKARPEEAGGQRDLAPFVAPALTWRLGPGPPSATAVCAATVAEASPCCQN